MKDSITIETTVKAPIDKVWKYWNEPAHIMQWCQASPEWYVPAASNDLRTGGTFTTTMAAKDGSMSFDFGGKYDLVKTNELIEYTMGDNRLAKIVFSNDGTTTKIVESFEPEGTNSREMQQGGWLAILDSFKNYTENN